MELGTVVSVAESLFSALQSSNLQEILSSFGYKSQLDELQDTVETIKAVLRDAETKQELSQQDQHWIEKLKHAVFEADDLFDEFVTLAEHKQLLEAHGSLTKKVSNFFSPSTNPLSLAYRMSCGIKDMRKKLKAIAYNSQFSFKIDSEPIRKRRPESCSYVNEVEIIGRENDLECIVSMLLASNNQCHVSFLSIVGIGGLGKTTLAQLVYNDPRVTDAFQLKVWTCVSDQDQKELDIKNILGKILGRNQEGSTMEQVQSQLRAQLARKKYLLVLDDVWTENRDHWCKLAEYLTGGENGSWIIVTTRSRKTATIIGGRIHELRGLSKKNSWRLFERTVFASNQLNPPDELVMIGQKIVDKCARVPLAIRVAGTLLYGQNKSKWLFVHKIGLANIRDEDNGIMPILKLSFHHLEPPLKNCFRYCALFPKDYVINKEMLISLWMAQGYIVPLDRFQSIEDAGEEYFAILLKRCFFQDIKRNKYGEIKTCKIHDLMHDIAQTVSGKEIYASDIIEGGNVDKNVRHLSIFNKFEYEKCYSLGNKTHIRSILSCHHAYDFHLAMETLDALVGRFRWLRVLDLSAKKIKCLPDSIGELLHLRYMDLSRNEDIEVLPNSITKLCNLQTLSLCCLRKLQELPKGLSKLVKLRVLDIRGCDNMTWMPRGMGKLIYLHTLKGGYRVGGGERCTSWKQFFYGLEDLKPLINLKGKLVIIMWWPKNVKNDVKEDMQEGLFLGSMEHLEHIKLQFVVEEDIDKENSDDEDSGRMDDEGMTMKLMEYLQPHSNLKRLTVRGYHGLILPTWATFLPYLVSLSLYECKELKCLSCLGNLCHLKSLYLLELPNLEYIEEDSKLLASPAENLSFFPSLELLDFVHLPKFKGWRGVNMEESSNNSTNNQHLQYRKCLPQLKKLALYKCPELACILLCPLLETLILLEFNERLQILHCTKTDEKSSEAAFENPDISGSSICVPKMREVNISNVAWLYTMPMESFHSLQTLTIYGDDEMMELPDWMQYLSALQTLRIEDCQNLKAMPNWMPKLTSLRILALVCCSKSLKKRCQKNPPGEDWPYLQHIPYIKYRR